MLRLFDFRRRRYRRERAAVETSIAQDDRATAASLIVAHLGRWSLNWQDGGRASILRDLGHLDWLSGRLGEISPDRASEIDELRSAIADMRGFYEDRGNFGLDGRMMKPANTARMMALQNEVGSRRMGIASRG